VPPDLGRSPTVKGADSPHSQRPTNTHLSIGHSAETVTSRRFVRVGECVSHRPGCGQSPAWGLPHWAPTFGILRSESLVRKRIASVEILNACICSSTIKSAGHAVGVADTSTVLARPTIRAFRGFRCRPIGSATAAIDASFAFPNSASRATREQHLIGRRHCFRSGLSLALGCCCCGETKRTHALKLFL